MKKFVFVLAFLASTVASAQVAPEEIFGGILDIIQDQINKDQGKSTGYGPGVILKDIGNNRIALGRVRLDADGQGQVSFVLPKCNQSENQAVTALRFRIDNADAYVDRVRIAFQNGETETVDVDKVYDENSVSDWYEIEGGKRCVKSITVRGKSVEIIDDNHFGNQFGVDVIQGFKKPFPGAYPPPPPPGHPGWGHPNPPPPPPGHYPGNPGWGQPPPPPPPGWGKPVPPPYFEPAPTVLTFIGLKANNNGGF